MWQQLVACAEKGGSSEAELQRKIDEGHTVLWPTENGCLALDRAVDGACVIWLGVGDMRQIVAQEEAIIAWAKERGCTSVRIEGRKGWQRIFPHWHNAGWDDGIVRLERKI